MNDFQVRIHYPLGDYAGRDAMVLRSDLDWNRDVEPVSVDPLGNEFQFELSGPRPWLAFKPCLRGSRFRWQPGPNKLALAGRPKELYPYFDASSTEEISPRLDVPLSNGGRQRLRVLLPPGYEENRLKRYPVLYMHDGKNLFLPEEAFLGREWRVDETLARLHTMNLIDQVIVVALYAEDRMQDYTAPGYLDYGRDLVAEVKPWIDQRFRTLGGPEHTGVMGSSLGGVVAFYLGWEYPQVFGMAACLSSTFGFSDDLESRVLNEDLAPRAETRFYLDSGWPRDNYEATQNLALALAHRGIELGSRLVYLAFPEGSHDERSWAERLHLPLQLFAGRLARSQRGILQPLLRSR